MSTHATPPQQLEFAGFTPKTMEFFRRLRRNNRREWFEAHRAEYERDVLVPLRALVEEMDARLARFFTVVAPALADEFGRIEYVDLRYTNGFAIGWQAAAETKLAQVTEVGTSG